MPGVATIEFGECWLDTGAATWHELKPCIGKPLSVKLGREYKDQLGDCFVDVDRRISIDYRIAFDRYINERTYFASERERLSRH